MNRFFFLLLLIVWLGECRPPQLQTSPTTVVTPRGTIEGFKVSFAPNLLSNYPASGKVFQGIPYVHAPTGERRFKIPEPVLHYATTPFIADRVVPACPQQSEREPITDEDCLYLNVMTPLNQSDDLYPVMVYIHGGAMDSGSARDMDMEGVIRNLVRHGVIVVTIQYRLGALGFFSTRSGDFPSNLGMLDQVEALRWVQSEISSFGGDPTRVTLFGHSAGAASISAHTYSPLSRGLFNSVIQLSGSVLTCLDGALGPADPSRQFAQLACNFTSADWENGDFTRLTSCLNSLSTDQLTAFTKLFSFGWKMVVDSYFLPSIPHKLAPFRQNVPVLIGSMRDEFEYFMEWTDNNLQKLPTGSKLLPTVGSMILGQEQLQSILPLLANYNTDAFSNDTLTARKGTSDVITGAAFIAPIQRDIREWMENGNFHIFIYEMTQPSHVIGHEAKGDWHPAVHSAELPYVSAKAQTWQNATDNNLATPADFQLMEWIGEAFTNFAKSGIPDSSWSPVSPFDRRLPYLEISLTERTMKSDYRSNDEQFWNVEVPQILGELPK